MAKKQTRRSISVSGDTYNSVRDYCDQHGLSASGLVTDLLNRYLVENSAGPPSNTEEPPPAEPVEEPEAEPREPEGVPRSATPIAISPPQPAGDVKYPDRRGPGFAPLPADSYISNWLVTAQLEISRKRQIDAHSSVETLLHNLMHRRMLSGAQIVKVELINEDH